MSPAIALSLALAGCGSGSAGLGWLLIDDPDDPSTLLTDLAVDPSPTNLKTSPASFSFVLTDPGSDLADVQVVILDPDGQTESAALLAPGQSTDDLSSAPSGVLHSFDWDFATQLSSGASYAAGFRLKARVAGGDWVISSPFDVGNDAPMLSDVTAPSSEVTGVVAISLTVSDSSGDVVDILVEYDNLDDPSEWLPASAAGSDLSGIQTSAAGVDKVFLWDVTADEPGIEFAGRLRLTPADPVATGVAELVDVLLDNNLAPIALLDGAAFFATPDRRRGIPVPFEVIDPEGGPIQVVFQWKTPLQAFPALPDDPAELSVVLADVAQHELLQIATERPARIGGRLVPVGPTQVRLPELGSSSSAVASGGLVGKELEILRNGDPPAALAWPSNALDAPVAVLAEADTTRVLVLDEPGGPSWRLVQIDVATGVVASVIASQPVGAPTAASWLRAPTALDRGSALLAVVQANVWSILSVEVADGTITPLHAAQGTTELGPVTGVVATGPDSALLTVGSSLVSVRWEDPGSVIEQSLVSDLEGPRALALAPFAPGILYVAEHDWINPATDASEGRVAALDLSTLERTSVPASGLLLRHPVGLAAERDRGRLIVLTDVVPLDGTTELRAVDLSGPGAGIGFQLGSGFPDDVGGLALGADELIAFVATQSSALFGRGGVEQRRSIVAVDPETQVVTVALAFDPPLSGHRAWRVLDTVGLVTTADGSASDVFVWDAGDLPNGGLVQLRSVPYDTERGISSATGAPREVAPFLGLEELAALPSNGIAAVALGDLNGDGRPDVVTANTDGDSLSVFYQTAGGEYPGSPNATLTGLPILAPVNEPIALAAGDLDDDGDADLVSANRSSNNVTVFTQLLAGTFTISPLAPGGSGDAPEDVALADFNGDGLLDLAVANGGASNIEVYHQLAAGLFSLLPSSTSGNASTLTPTGLSTGDVDLDGDIDFVVALYGSDRIAVYRQPGTGVFAAAPGELLGGPGITDGPVKVAVADLDLNGLPDVVSANADGNDLTVFLQEPSAGFGAAPDHVLNSATGPLRPLHVEVADVDRDGFPDVLSTNQGGDLHFYTSDSAGEFDDDPVVIDAGLSSPRQSVVRDLDGDGLLDVAVANTLADEVVLLTRTGAGSFAGPAPDVRLGGSASTPAPTSVALGDLDSDGDLDLVCASSGGDVLAVFPQLSPALFSTVPSFVLGSAALTTEPRCVDVGDVDGDGRIDVVSANAGSGSLSVFLQSAGGTFGSVPDASFGAGQIGAPTAVCTEDLDRDGDLDVVCAALDTHEISVFLRQPTGSYTAAPDFQMGGAAESPSPAALDVGDLDGDGYPDLVVASTASDALLLFYQSPPLSFPTSPQVEVGSAASTPGPAAVVLADLDRDGDLDLVSANSDNHTLTVFLQSAAGTFPAAPSRVLTHASLSLPVSVAVADIDLDGDADILGGYDGSNCIAIFRGTQPGVYASVPRIVGGTGALATPLSLLAADIDGDGDPDLVMADGPADSLALYFGSH